MANESGTIVNPVKTSTKHAFRDALKRALNDLYNKDTSTNIHRFYDVMGEQLKDIDIHLKRALSDQWISTSTSNERKERSFSQFDLLQEEGAFDLTYIGFVPENTQAFQNVELTTGDEFIQLNRIPATTDLSSFSLSLNGVDQSELIVGFDQDQNRLVITQPEEAGDYVLTYIDKGCTLERTEGVNLSRNEDGNLEGTTQGKQILFDSERLVIQNSAIGVLIRDEDYTIDYTTGAITSLPEGRIELLDPDVLDVSYRFCFDFSTLTEPAFHKQVFGETARVLDEQTLEVDSAYVSEVFRVYNVNTRQELIPFAVSRDRITLRSEDALSVVRRVGQPAIAVSTRVDTGLIVREFTVQIPVGESKNAIQTVANPKAESRLVRLVLGGREQLPAQISLKVPFETKRIRIVTGGSDARTSNKTLTEGLDYSFRTPTPNEFVITWLDSGIEKIGNNSVYAQLSTDLTPIEQTPTPETREFGFKTKLNPPSELYPVQGLTILLPEAYTYVDPGNNGDVRLTEEILVTTRSGTSQYIQGTDYSYDGINKVISINPNSPMRQEEQVRVFFLGVNDHFVDYLAVPDVITVDYDTTRNSIDWSKSLSTFNVRITETLTPDNNLVKLVYHPDDPLDLPKIKIRNRNDARDRLKALSYDRNQRFLVVEAPTQEGDYIIEYVGHRHLVSPGYPYYVSYRYGGRDRALRNVWSPLLGLTQTERRRYEEKQLNGNQTSIGLDYPPSDLDEIVIYLKGDSEDEPATTITGYDPETNTVSFTPLRQFGTYIVAYNTPNALTEDLRKFVIGMIEAFLTGPTKRGIEKMIETFTDITPDVRVATDLAFKLADETFNSDPEKRSDSLNDVQFYSINADFVPSRFNNGFLSTGFPGTYLAAPSLTNVRTTEGTIEFLIGPRFNGDNDLTHYFVDIGVPGEYYKNRMTIYKNQRNYLVFETHDNAGRLWRVASDVGRKRTQIYQFLTKGATSLELPSRPAFVTTDIDNDGQFDFFGAHKTEFIIRRVPGDSTEEGYGYSTGYGYAYGYRGEILQGSNLDVSSPLAIAVHFQIPNKLEYNRQSGFDSVTRKLQAVAQQVKSRGGVLVVHASPVYIEACEKYSNVLKSLQDDGHEIGLYIDFPSFMTESSERNEYLEDVLVVARDTLELTVNSCSGNSKILEWALFAKDLDLEIVGGYVDPIFNETFDNRSPIVRRVRTSETFGLLDAPGGDLVYLPGATYVNFTMPVSPLTIQQVESTLRRAITMNDVTKIASWYFTLTPDDLSSAYLDEAALIGDWITDTIDPLVSLRQVRWSTFNDMGEIFVALEQWLDSLDAEEQLTTDRGVSVRPLTYDFDTNTINFEPVPSDGIYEFDYVSGWAAYEESEIFVAVVYKFRTDDGSLPYYKLFINGELQEFVTFADFPEAGEG